MSTTSKAICSFCQRTYATQRTLKQHQLSCNRKKEAQEKIAHEHEHTAVEEAIHKQRKEDDEKIAELQTRISFLLERNAFLEERITKITNACKAVLDV